MPDDVQRLDGRMAIIARLHPNKAGRKAKNSAFMFEWHDKYCIHNSDQPSTYSTPRDTGQDSDGNGLQKAAEALS